MRGTQRSLTPVMRHRPQHQAPGHQAAPSQGDGLGPSAYPVTAFLLQQKPQAARPERTGQSDSGNGEWAACYTGLHQAGENFERVGFLLVLLVGDASRQKPCSRFQPV